MSEKKEERTIFAWVHAKKETWEDKYSYVCYSVDMSEYGYIPIQSVPIHFMELSHEDLILAHIRVLRAKESAIQAEAFVKLEAVREEIQSLLAIGVTIDE